MAYLGQFWWFGFVGEGIRNVGRGRKLIQWRDSVLGMEMINGNNSVIKFTLEEIKKATKKFSRENLIRCGGYANVYKGILPDGSEVVLKRFKNFSVTGDESFAHEVEIIASVRHASLVALRGYSIATMHPKGHQRIIVCDLICNGSLYDHIFGSGMKKLSWPIRQNIALGVARGLAYLHYGVQPAIIIEMLKLVIYFWMKCSLQGDCHI